ncbi:hypothetical protein B0H11DRAFT_1956613 [Mycena galericulata]|nr:hypothetical protein B0H11DRAFT_1956613 [Mycena galericulata]
MLRTREGLRILQLVLLSIRLRGLWCCSAYGVERTAQREVREPAPIGTPDLAIQGTTWKRDGSSSSSSSSSESL